MSFEDFIGNSKIKEQLSYLVEAKRLPHAIILEGEEGIGKKTLAREIALNLFCRSEDEKPCRSCPQCKKVIKKIHPDFFEYTAPDRPNSFSVNTVREVRDDAFMQPNEAEYKFYILGNAHSMNDKAQNALLKILEEPPKYAIFILTVTNKSAMLETVLSRSVVFSLERVDASEGAEYITEHREGTDYQSAKNAMEACGGNIGKAIQSLEDGKYAKITEAARSVARAVLSENEYDLIVECSQFAGDREMLIMTMPVLKAVFRDALVKDSASYMSADRETAALLSERLSRKKLLKLSEVCDSIRELTERNCNNALLITKLSADLRRAAGK